MWIGDGGLTERKRRGEKQREEKIRRGMTERRTRDEADSPTSRAHEDKKREEKEIMWHGGKPLPACVIMTRARLITE